MTNSAGGGAFGAYRDRWDAANLIRVHVRSLAKAHA